MVDGDDSEKPSKKVSGVDNTFRRKWDRDEFLERARERSEQESDDEEGRYKPKARTGPPIQRQHLKHRDFTVDLESRLGKTQVVTPVTPLNQQAGYHCNVCDCVVKDSANYLDHINGKKHQRALGMSMRVKRSSLSEVQERFGALKRKEQETQGFTEADFDLRIQRQLEEEEAERKLRKEKKKEKKREKEADFLDEGEMDPEMAALMGFGGFGSSKKS